MAFAITSTVGRGGGGTFGVGISLEGAAAIKTLLKTLSPALARKTMRIAIKRALKPALQAAKNNVTTRTRQLKKSLGIVVRTYRNSGATLGLMGPRHGFKKVIDGRAANPVNYAHLVEFGHRVASGGVLLRKGKLNVGLSKRLGTHVGNVPAQPFMRPAFVSTRGAINRILVNEVGKGLDKELQKRAGLAGKRRRVA
ncbi:MAG: HK97 gp10 family phage protein [Planctomycetes bacterium]|nr:HK97 gp10 family phage protein [Planctomycetota bacterium]